MSKARRNDPCPCGSGKKYKKCCLLKRGNKFPIVPSISELNGFIHEKKQAEQNYRQRFGEIRPSISANYKGYKLVAIGDKLLRSKNWKTFTDFLMSYIFSVFGKDWVTSEKVKPYEQRHLIMKWYDTSCRFLKTKIKDTDGLYKVIPNGAMRAYLLLSYDLYLLQHHSLLQENIVRRLKQKDQFQGARHELFAAATCIRAGCDIKYEDETDSSSRHIEFTAIHKRTGQKIAIEAKSRHRPGILGRPGTPKTSNMVQAGIKRLLQDAFKKPVLLPYVIFFDLNLPPTPEPLMEKPWVQEILSTVDKVAEKHGAQDCFNLIVFTNEPDHYGECNEPAPQGNYLSIISQKPKKIATHPEAIVAIHKAAEKYGNIPNTFKEAGCRGRGVCDHDKP